MNSKTKTADAGAPVAMNATGVAKGLVQGWSGAITTYFAAMGLVYGCIDDAKVRAPASTSLDWPAFE
jgi:hypothetical protein